MDVHIIPGIKAKDVAEAHQKDLFHQEEFGCKCMTYWVDEERENVFCLIDAPDKEVVEKMHSKAHGLIPNKIIEVSSSLVQSFLGRIYDPETELDKSGLKVFHDPSFRVLLVTLTEDPVLLQHRLGTESANNLLAQHNEIVREQFSLYEGNEVEHSGTGFIGSFTIAAKAVNCAIAIQQQVKASELEAIDFRIAISAGEPIAGSEQLFGDTIRAATYLGTVAKNLQIAIAPVVKDLVSNDIIQPKKQNILSIHPQDEMLLALLFAKLEENWQDPDFGVEDYCRAMAMSKSQLYRKTVEFFGLSPNLLLKDFRLQKAKALMKEQRYSISEITFGTGFTSPSYFTKCFKKKYDLLPNAYLELLQQ